MAEKYFCHTFNIVVWQRKLLLTYKDYIIRSPLTQTDKKAVCVEYLSFDSYLLNMRLYFYTINHEYRIKLNHISAILDLAFLNIMRSDPFFRSK